MFAWSAPMIPAPITPTRTALVRAVIGRATSGGARSGGQLGHERLLVPVVLQGPPHELGLALRIQRADRRVAVQVRREGVALGGRGDDVVQVRLGAPAALRARSVG